MFMYRKIKVSLRIILNKRLLFEQQNIEQGILNIEVRIIFIKLLLL